jgi:uncharacterized beta-barrel protein YwiB (DUF1934 family)
MVESEFKIDNDDIVVNIEKFNPHRENAIIKIETTYYGKDGHDDDETEITTKGLYRMKGNVAQIVYQDSELTGFYDSETKVTAHGESFVSILRKGNKVDSNLMVQCGKKLFSEYSTPMGSIAVGIMGNTIENHFDEDGGTLRMNYTLDMNGSLVSDNEIKITVRLL